MLIDLEYTNQSHKGFQSARASTIWLCELEFSIDTRHVNVYLRQPANYQMMGLDSIRDISGLQNVIGESIKIKEESCDPIHSSL